MMLATASRPLEIADDVALTDEQLARLGGIEEYDLWFVIERVGRKGGVAPHLIGQAVGEFKKYMALVALGHTEVAMTSPEVDEIWHNFILFTREYGEFCEKLCGRMIHHRPNTSRRPGLPEGSVREFVSAYNKFFGEPPPIWRLGAKRHAPAGGALLAGDCDADPAPPGCDTGPGGLYSASTGDCNTGPSGCRATADCNSTPGPPDTPPADCEATPG